MKKRTVKNESKLSEPNTSKAEKSDYKRILFKTTVTWPWILRELGTQIAHFHCALFAGKNYQIWLWSRQSLVVS
jgi:hypothetical protein